MELRIVGICPVVTDLQQKDTLDLYWAYFPEARKYLASEKITRYGLPANIKTLDDLFFFRFFYGQIYKESTPDNRQLSDYMSGQDIEKEAQRIDILMLEAEHDCWISTAR